MRRPSLNSVTRRVSSRRSSLLSAAPQPSARCPAIKVRTRGPTPARSPVPDLPTSSTLAPSSGYGHPAPLDLNATMDPRILTEPQSRSARRTRLKVRQREASGRWASWRLSSKGLSNSIRSEGAQKSTSSPAKYADSPTFLINRRTPPDLQQHKKTTDLSAT